MKLLLDNHESEVLLMILLNTKESLIPNPIWLKQNIILLASETLLIKKKTED